jgi:hypothetical protein
MRKTTVGQVDWAASFPEYTEFVGLPEYRALEEEYLPASQLARKYSAEGEPVGAAPVADPRR